MIKLMLDPGHGGSDPGAMYGGLEEKDITLRIASMVKQCLFGFEFDVQMTRTDDSFPALKDRVALANTWKADYLVSIHCNADPDEDLPGMHEAHGEEIWYHERGKLLAEMIGWGLQTELPAEPWRGIKQGNLYVTRDCQNGIHGLCAGPRINCPSALVETAFIDTSASVRRLSNPTDRVKIARGIVRGLLRIGGTHDV